MQIETNIPEVLRKFDGLTRQIPFALSRALNDTAALAANTVRAELPKHFIIRTNWVPGAIRWRPSTKANLEAIVGVSDKSGFMVEQELGGVKKRGAHEQAIPVTMRGPDKQGTTLRGRWPGALGKKSEHVFIIRTGSRVGLVEKRVGRGRKQTKILYVLLGKGVRIKPRWNFRARVHEVARAVLPVTFAARLHEAVGTAK